MSKIDEIKSLEALRQKEWRKFLFKEAMVLNVIIYCCALGSIYFLMQAFFPSWYVGEVVLSPHSRFTYEEEFAISRGKVQEQGGIFAMIILMFSFAMFMIKFAFYHSKYILGFNQIDYFKAYQKFNEKYFLNQFFIFSEKYFPIEAIRDSEIVSHDKKTVIDSENGKEMFESSGYFSGYLNGREAMMSNVMSKGTYKDKGRTHVIINYNALTIMVDLQTNIPNSFRLKLEHDRTGQLFGQLLQFSKLGADSLIKLKDRKLERLFKVYSNDPIEAEAFLTAERNSVIKDWKLLFDSRLKATLINNRLTVAFPKQGKLLYPKVYKRCTLKSFERDCKMLQNIFNDIALFSEKENRVEGHAV